jgi:hypothetical protein
MTPPNNTLDRQGWRHCRQLWGTRSTIVLPISEFKRQKNDAIRRKKKNNLGNKKKRIVSQVEFEIKAIKVAKKCNKNKRG